MAYKVTKNQSLNNFENKINMIELDSIDMDHKPHVYNSTHQTYAKL
jgi:hypothetical protein